MNVSRATLEDRARADALLAARSLPPLPRTLAGANVLVALAGGEVVGVVGLEVQGLHGIVSALAVADTDDPAAVARSLLYALVSRANEISLRTLFVLGEDADGWFAAAGFLPVSEDSVPLAIRTTRSFRAPRPATSRVLRFELARRCV